MLIGILLVPSIRWMAPHRGGKRITSCTPSMLWDCDLVEYKLILACRKIGSYDRET